MARASARATHLIPERDVAPLEGVAQRGQLLVARQHVLGAPPQQPLALLACQPKAPKGISLEPTRSHACAAGGWRCGRRLDARSSRCLLRRRSLVLRTTLIWPAAGGGVTACQPERAALAHWQVAVASAAGGPAKGQGASGKRQAARWADLFEHGLLAVAELLQVAAQVRHNGLLRQNGGRPAGRTQKL